MTTPQIILRRWTAPYDSPRRVYINGPAMPPGCVACFLESYGLYFVTIRTGADMTAIQAIADHVYAIHGERFEDIWRAAK